MIRWFKKLFWARCAYCNEKKDYYFWCFETNIGETPDYIEGTEQICTDCASKYFNN
jgi:hypothetical protein